jgi:hypothetical protein
MTSEQLGHPTSGLRFMLAPCRLGRLSNLTKSGLERNLLLDPKPQVLRLMWREPTSTLPPCR